MLIISLLVIKVVLAFVLILAGLTKLASPKEAIDSVKRMGIKSQPVAFLSGLALPIVELTLAILLLIPVTTEIAYIACAMLFAFFILILGINILRGNNVPCGCFGQHDKEPINWKTIMRTGAFLFASISGAVTDPQISASGEGEAIWGVIVVAGAFMAVVGIMMVIWPAVVGSEDFSLETTKEQGTIGRRNALKVIGGTVIAAVVALFLPQLSEAAICCRCEWYHHFEGEPCCDPTQDKTIHHYFCRCCNTCTGEYGYWHNCGTDTCTFECPCGQPHGGCSYYTPCRGSGCYQSECESAGCPR